MTANEAHYPGKMAPYRENGNDGKNVGGYGAQNEHLFSKRNGSFIDSRSVFYFMSISLKASLK